MLQLERTMTAEAYRGDDLVCDHVDVRVYCDRDRVGLTVRERRCYTARFADHIDGQLRKELGTLARRRGAASKRIADQLEPIELVTEDGTFVGKLRPPDVPHRGDLDNIEFAILRELDAGGPARLH